MVRIAIPVHDRRGLDDEVFEHFGHAPAFLIVDIEGQKITEVRTVENPHAEEHGPGAVPSFLAELGVSTLICRGVGRRALVFFQQLGIEVIRGATGKVSDVLSSYLRGELESRDYEPARKWHEMD